MKYFIIFIQNNDTQGIILCLFSKERILVKEQENAQ